ncbi:MAG TPA: VWA domain-containing protein, partial [Chloroflexota bacterium]
MRYRYSRWDGTQTISPFDPDEVIDSLADELLGDGDVRSALQRILQRGFQPNQGDRTMGLQQLLERLRQQRQQRLDRYDMSGIMDQIKEKLADVIQTERSGIDRRLDEARGQSPDDSQQGTETQEGEPMADSPLQDGGSEASSPLPLGEAGRRPAGPSPGEGEPSGASAQAQRSQASQSPSPEQLQLLENIAARKQAFLDQLPPDVAGSIKELNDYEFMDPEARE